MMGTMASCFEYFSWP